MINKFRNFFDIAQNKMGKLNNFEKVVLLGHYLQARCFVGADKTDFFEFRLFEKSLWGKEQYVSERRLMDFAKQANNQRDRMVFKNKAKFNEVFSEYVNRKSLNMQMVTEEEFLDFVSTARKIFVKPTNGLCGKGAYVQEVSQDTNVKKLYENLAGQEIIVEEVVEQNAIMASFNPTSVNTIRVVTFVNNDGVPVIVENPAIRLGRKGKNADNFHQGGIGAIIDIETGIVSTKGIDRNGVRYINHPDSGVQIIGFRVPFWKEICETVKTAALLVPGVRYVGWDVAITNEDKIVFIEGNDEASPDLAQMSGERGLWVNYKQYLDQVNLAKGE